jgi:dTDP-4-amino-4,6-dideoxygalactose transaminase
MALPMFPELEAADQARVIGAVADFVRMRHRLAA